MSFTIFTYNAKNQDFTCKNTSEVIATIKRLQKVWSDERSSYKVLVYRVKDDGSKTLLFEQMVGDINDFYMPLDFSALTPQE